MSIVNGATMMKCSMASALEVDQYVACLDQLPAAAYQSHLEQLSMELKNETGVSFNDLDMMSDGEIDEFFAGLTINADSDE